jgi:hypothetical protein
VQGPKFGSQGLLGVRGVQFLRLPPKSKNLDLARLNTITAYSSSASVRHLTNQATCSDLSPSKKIPYPQGETLSSENRAMRWNDDLQQIADRGAPPEGRWRFISYLGFGSKSGEIKDFAGLCRPRITDSDVPNLYPCSETCGVTGHTIFLLSKRLEEIRGSKLAMT